MTDTPVRPRDRFLVFGAPQVGEAEIAEVVDTLRSGWWGTGPKAAEFERRFADYVGAPHAAALGSCTAALHLAMHAAGIKPGDEVITTPLTFCATVNAIVHTGATPVLADVDPVTMNIDVDAVAAKITPRTKALMIVHFGGRPCDVEALGALVDRHGLLLIEDCAHAIEAKVGDQHAGTFGDFGAFSFYVTKNVATGEGGMVVSAKGEAADRIRILGLHGMSKDAWKRYGDEGYRHYDVVAAGFKSNMMDIQASIGLHQLARVEENLLRRAEVWERYNQAFADLPITLPTPPAPGTRHAMHLYTLLIDGAVAPIDRDAFLDGMTRQGIGTGVQYRAIPEHPFYRERFGWRPEEWPHATRIGRQTVSVPLSAALSEADVEDVITATRRVLGA